MKKILLVDDDLTIHTIIKGIVKDQWAVVSCASLNEANAFLDQENSPPLLAIIDRMLPDGDGVTLCNRIRSDSRLSSIPIIFLSALNSEAEKVTGLFAGADDYISKPFGVLEMKARIQARLRQGQKKISLGNLSVDLASHRVFIQKSEGVVEVELTRREFKILMTLIQSPDQIFSRELLLSKVWGEDTNVSDRVVDTSMSHLRKKIAGCGLILEALRGEGYRISVEPKNTQAA